MTIRKVEWNKDTYTGKSLMPFSNDYFVLVVTSILIIIGASGFPVLIEIKGYVPLPTLI